MDRIHAGSHGAEAIPVPIPNSEVKLRSADDTGCVPGKQVAAGFFFVLFPHIETFLMNSLVDIYLFFFIVSLV